MDLEKIAEKFGMIVNPDKDRVQIVLNKLATIKESEGVGYCPCFPQHNQDTVCPCKYMRKMNVCRCGLYKPKEE